MCGSAQALASAEAANSYSTNMSSNVFHGSEDGTYEPTEDGVSATIDAGPRAPSNSPLSVCNNPLLVQPMLLEEMDAEGMCIYLTNLVGDADLVKHIREMLGTPGGRRWTELLSAVPDWQSCRELRWLSIVADILGRERRGTDVKTGGIDVQPGGIQARGCAQADSSSTGAQGCAQADSQSTRAQKKRRVCSG